MVKDPAFFELLSTLGLNALRFNAIGQTVVFDEPRIPIVGMEDLIVTIYRDDGSVRYHGPNRKSPMRLAPA